MPCCISAGTAATTAGYAGYGPLWHPFHRYPEVRHAKDAEAGIAKQADVPTGKPVYYLQYIFATLKTLSCIFACPDSGECPGYGSQKKWTKSGTGLAGTAWGWCGWDGKRHDCGGGL